MLHFLCFFFFLLFFPSHRDCKALPLWKPGGCSWVPAVHSGCYAKVLLTWNQVSVFPFKIQIQLRIIHLLRKVNHSFGLIKKKKLWAIDCLGKYYYILCSLYRANPMNILQRNPVEIFQKSYMQILWSIQDFIFIYFFLKCMKSVQSHFLSSVCLADHSGYHETYKKGF